MKIKYHFYDEIEGWEKTYPAKMSREDVFAEEKEEQLSLMDKEGSYCILSMYADDGVIDPDDPDHEPERTLLHEEFVQLHPDPPSCIDEDGDEDEDEDQDHDWRHLSLYGGAGNEITHTEQCARCQSMRSTHTPQNLPHNGSFNDVGYEIVTYSQPEDGI